MIWSLHPQRWWCWTRGVALHLEMPSRRSATPTKRRWRRRRPPRVHRALSPRRTRRRVRRRGAAGCRFAPRRRLHLPRRPCWAKPTGPRLASDVRSGLSGQAVCIGEATKQWLLKPTSWRRSKPLSHIKLRGNTHLHTKILFISSHFKKQWKNSPKTSEMCAVHFYSALKTGCHL